MLARRGHDVVVFERFDAPRPVGSGIILQPTGLAVLRTLGLEQETHRLGQRIDRIDGVSMPSGKRVLDVDYAAMGAGFHGVAVHRAALFDVLYGALRAEDIELRTSVDIADAARERGGISAVDTAGRRYGPFDLLLDASGAGTKLQRLAERPARLRELEYGALWGAFDWPECGFDEHTLQQRYVGAHTMLGVLPIGRHSAADRDQVAFFWSIKGRDYERWRRDGLQAWKQEVLAIWPEVGVIVEQITDPSEMALARYGHGTLRKPYGDRIAFLGDAAHSTSPQLGQGANMALLDAWSIADALQRTDDANEASLRYAKTRRWHVRAFQLSSLALTPFYQSDSRVLSGLRDLLFDPVAKLPLFRRVVAGLITGMLAGYGPSSRKLGAILASAPACEAKGAGRDEPADTVIAES